MEPDKPTAPDTMTPGALASLVDTAFKCPNTLAFLDTLARTFAALGRHEDADAVSCIALLYDRGEVEALLRLRAAWRRGFTRNLADVARRVADLHR